MNTQINSHYQQVVFIGDVQVNQTSGLLVNRENRSKYIKNKKIKNASGYLPNWLNPTVTVKPEKKRKSRIGKS